MTPPDKVLQRLPGPSTSKITPCANIIVTLHLLETIKEACRDHSKRRRKKEAP
jgi:hypothetical protein